MRATRNLRTCPQQLSQETAMNTTSTSSTSRFSPRALRIVIAVGVLAVASAFTLSAFARGGFGGHGMGGMMGHMAERMLDRVNASADQKAQIKKITESAMADLKGQHEGHKALRDQAMTLFTQPNVDANAVEQLRQQMLKQHDQASLRMSQALVEASRVLTPEQRKQLAGEMAKRGEMMKRHHDERRALDGDKSKS
jgi:periplasmic protein CpxP/Spy